MRRRRLWKFGDAVRFLHAPPPRLSALTQKALDARTHPAWTRLKFDELLAQQLSLKAHRKARASRRAPVLTGTGALTRALLDARAVQADARAGARVARDRHDLQRATPMQRLLQGDVGSRQDDRRGARRAAGDRKRHGRSRSWRRPKSSPSSTTASSQRGSTGLRRRDRVAVRLAAGEGSGARRVAALASGERAVRGRHACAVPGRRRDAAARPRDRRRAASLRRRAAARAARQGRSAKRTS